jgi:hypothetical protein
MNQIDVGLRKVFKAGRARFEPTIDFFNLLNNAAIVARTTQLGPAYGRAANIQRGRLIRAGLRVEF